MRSTSNPTLPPVSTSTFLADAIIERANNFKEKGKFGSLTDNVVALCQLQLWLDKTADSFKLDLARCVEVYKECLNDPADDRDVEIAKEIKRQVEAWGSKG